MAASVAVETTAYQRCQDHGTTTKGSCRLESSQTEPTEQALGVADHKARGAELPKPLGAQKIVSEPQMPDSEILRLLDFGFALI